MKPHHACIQHTAACGALVVGASWLDSGVMPGLVVVDSSRRAFEARIAAVKPASIGGVANISFALACNGH
jgi:hypothetical protein